MKDLHAASGNQGNGILRLSLNAKICVAATSLVLLSLGVTAVVIGVKSNNSAQAAAMQLTRTTGREVAGALQSRLGNSVATVITVSEVVRSTKVANLPMQRDQISEVVRTMLAASSDWVGASVAMEANALDGQDATSPAKSRSTMTAAVSCPIGRAIAPAY